MSTIPTTEPDPSAALETQKFRSQIGQISRHSSVFFAGTMFTAAIGYLFKIYLARKLGAEALGLYALGMLFFIFHIDRHLVAIALVELSFGVF